MRIYSDLPQRANTHEQCQENPPCVSSIILHLQSGKFCIHEDGIPSTSFPLFDTTPCEFLPTVFSVSTSPFSLIKWEVCGLKMVLKDVFNSSFLPAGIDEPNTQQVIMFKTNLLQNCYQQSHCGEAFSSAQWGEGKLSGCLSDSLIMRWSDNSWT